ncbi:MAG: NADPH:quinone reductase, partial [Tetragenococcus halophilus]|nr:NADPH:quinone reductase [Tetragenococcus halophilus]MDN6129217.1 NADPH:quinone reductase [Tetragenococcus halophilus]
SFYMARQSIKGFVISHATLEELQSSAHHLNYFFNRGLLLDDELFILPLKKASFAHEMLEAGKEHRKRIVLTPNDCRLNS